MTCSSLIIFKNAYYGLREIKQCIVIKNNQWLWFTSGHITPPCRPESAMFHQLWPRCASDKFHFLLGQHPQGEAPNVGKSILSLLSCPNTDDDEEEEDGQAGSPFPTH